MQDLDQLTRHFETFEVLGCWHHKDRDIVLAYDQEHKQLVGKIIQSNGFERVLSSQEIRGIPKFLSEGSIRVMIRDSYVHVNPTLDGNMILSIHPRIRGGGLSPVGMKRHKKLLWPKGVVPFTIDIESFQRNISKVTWPIHRETVARIINEAIDKFNERYLSDYSVRLVPRTHQGDYLVFRNAQGNQSMFTACDSKIGRRGGEQVIYCVVSGSQLLSAGDYGAILHDICHAVGLSHEDQRQDRDRYVQVDTVYPRRRSSKSVFGKLRDVRYGGYDFSSIMHRPLGNHADHGAHVSIKLQPSLPEAQSAQLTDMSENFLRVGQRRALSKGDVATLSALYPLQDWMLSDDCEYYPARLIERNAEVLLAFNKKTHRIGVLTMPTTEYLSARWVSDAFIHGVNDCSPWELSAKDKIIIADINGDGIDEVILYGQQAMAIIVWQEHGLVVHSRIEKIIPSCDGISKGWTISNIKRAYAADIDGDGCQEIILRGVHCKKESIVVLKMMSNALVAVSSSHHQFFSRNEKTHWSLRKNDEIHIVKNNSTNQDRVGDQIIIKGKSKHNASCRLGIIQVYNQECVLSCKYYDGFSFKKTKKSQFNYTTKSALIPLDSDGEGASKILIVNSDGQVALVRAHHDHFALISAQRTISSDQYPHGVTLSPKNKFYSIRLSAGNKKQILAIDEKGNMATMEFDCTRLILSSIQHSQHTCHTDQHIILKNSRLLANQVVVSLNKSRVAIYSSSNGSAQLTIAMTEESIRGGNIGNGANRRYHSVIQDGSYTLFGQAKRHQAERVARPKRGYEPLK